MPGVPGLAAVSTDDVVSVTVIASSTLCYLLGMWVGRHSGKRRP